MDYNLFVWEGMFSGWTPGLLCVLAMSVEHARNVAKQKIQSSGDDERDPRILDSEAILAMLDQIDSIEPVMVTSPEASYVRGVE